MSYKITLKEFDEKISNYVKYIQATLNNIAFNPEESITFINQIDFDGKDLFNNKNQKGLYLFELNLESEKLVGMKNATKISNFAKEWSKKGQNSFFSSSIIDKRLKLQLDFKEQWLPIYIGKSKDIDKRIKEHLSMKPDKHTYAMKLNHRKSMYDLEFRVSKIEIDVENYDFIVPHLERVLRDKYLPIIGKQ
jgi:hypothetical protein